MKKFLLIIAVVSLTILNCKGLTKNFSENSNISNDKVVVIGRVFFSPPLKQEIESGFSKNFSSGKYYVVFTDKLHEDAPVNPHLLSATAAGAQVFGKYFMLEIPKTVKYFHNVSVLLYKKGAYSKMMYIKMNIPIRLNTKDKFIYVGDFNFYRNKHRGLSLKIINNYSHVKDKFSKFVKSNNSYVMPVNNLLIKKKPILIHTYWSTASRR